MKKFILLSCLPNLVLLGQCDLAITDVNLNTYEVTVDIINGDSCGVLGPNGTNEGVNMIQIAYHIPGVDEGMDFGDLGTYPYTPYTCSTESSYHPGWAFGEAYTTYNYFDTILVSGQQMIINLTSGYSGECNETILNYYLNQGECIEFVIWQINYGHTWYANDGENTLGGGWATVGWNNNGIQPDNGVKPYPDMDCDNSWYTCRYENPSSPVNSYLDCNGCIFDLDGDGLINVSDLINILPGWGDTIDATYLVNFLSYYNTEVNCN